MKKPIKNQGERNLTNFARSLGSQLDRILECRPELIESAIKDFGDESPDAKQIVQEWVASNDAKLKEIRQGELVLTS